MKYPRDEQIGLALLVAGLIALLASMPGLVMAGPAPLRVLLGWGAIVAVAALTLGGVAAAFAPKLGWRVRWEAAAWGELLGLALLVFSHLGLADPLATARSGGGGGLVGWALSQLLEMLLPVPMAQAIAITGALIAAWLLWRALPPDWTGGVEERVLSGLRALRGAADRGLSSIRSLAARQGAGEVPLSGGMGAASASTKAGQAPTHAVYFPVPDADDRWASVDERLDRWENAGRALVGRIFPPGWGGATLAWLGQLFRNLQPGGEREGERERGSRGEREQGRSSAPSSLRPSRSPAPLLPPVSASPAPRAPKPRPRPSTLPPLDLLRPDSNDHGGNADARQRAQTLVQTLAEFNVPVEVVSIKEGPTVTQFGLEPGEIVRELRNGEVLRRRVSVHSILRLNNDLALALAAPSIRIEAPVPGRPYVGVEIPNTAKTLVSLRSILEAREFAKVASPLALALGRDVSGDPVVADLPRMPHLLIAGATGSGKSVCINAIVCSLLMNNGPESVRFLMVDPKMVELPGYNGIPHLLGPVITDPTQVVGALAWLTLQMDDRYRLFAANGVRNIGEFNKKAARSKTLDALPFLILVIDELADLMMTAAFDIERQICRLAQMSRATGIHLVLATQRPSVDVITGLIKANFPARIAFAVTSQIDSRVILDTPGAEKLLGRGDMLLMVPESAKLSRIQGCFVSDREIDAVVEFWRASRGAEGEASDPVGTPWAGMVDQMEEKDDLLEKALQLLQTKHNISTSSLQRQLRIGYPRAARLMEQLEEMGVVGAGEGGGRSREVLYRATGPAAE
ncbi:MAG: DNA translocase FtsK [Chloroflexi bacterium]|nr:DNA translocase FtsK [Chloroflexota bacterium]